MPLNQNALAGDQLVQLIVQRKSTGRISKTDTKKIGEVTKAIQDCGLDSRSTMKAFVDHAIPENRSSRSPRNLKTEWNRFEQEILPEIENLFPVTPADNQLWMMFEVDWNSLPGNPHRLGQFFINRQITRPFKVSKLYLGSPDFYRFLAVVRYYQNCDLQARFPLFTLRSFLAAQAEALGSFVDRLKLGNLTSEKAKERYEDWYEKKYYSYELVHKAKTRPSANNPVCNESIRLEYEMQQVKSGNLRRDLVLGDEAAVPFYNICQLYVDKKLVVRYTDNAEVEVLPPSLRG